MFYTVHCSINVNRNQQNAQMIYICSICSTYVFWLCLNTYTQLFNLILIISIPHDVWVVENIFTNSYTLYECTHHCITY